MSRRAVPGRAGRWMLLAVVVAGSGWAGWPPVRAHLQAVAVLDQVSGKAVPGAISSLVEEPVTTEEIEIPAPGGAIRARIYSPATTRHPPALVLLHGVHHLGMEEPRLMNFAAAMASCGMVVLTPELPAIRDYHVGRTSIDTIGESTRWFAQKTGGPAGVMGLSFSGGLALLAASDPRYHRDFKFVFAVGAQGAMQRVAKYYRTGAEVRPDGTIERLAAHEYGPLVLEYEHLEDFVPAADLEALRPVLRAHLYEDKAGENRAAARLSKVQKLEALELMDATSAGTLRKLEQAEVKYEEEMEGVSPQLALATLTTPVYLLHGEADNIIPAAETLWMAGALPGGSLKAMLVSPVLSHVDFDGAKPGLADQWRLLHFFAKVMQANEGGR